MQSRTLLCPQCNFEIQLDQVLSGQIESEMQKKYDAKLDTEKRQMWVIAQQKAEEKAQQESDLKVKSLETELEERRKKQTEMEQKELDFLRKVRDLEDQKKNFDLELERKILEKSKLIEEEANRKAGEHADLKLKEREMQIEQMRRTIEELRRKSEQGSMQVQGDAQENELKEILALAFPHDLITDVATGIKGADLMQLVRSEFGIECGTIIWEVKNTKVWTAEWIRKLKEDQASSQADLAIIVSRTLPADVDSCVNIEGVWVVGIKFALSVAQVLRNNLIEVAGLKRSLVGTDEKMERLHRYLVGPQFKNRIENIVLAFTEMKMNLEKEKNAMQRIWAKRDQEIGRVSCNTTGMYGDLQGLLGAEALGTVEVLELPE